MDIYDKGISHEKREALELAEASRESQWNYLKLQITTKGNIANNPILW